MVDRTYAGSPGRVPWRTGSPSNTCGGFFSATSHRSSTRRAHEGTTSDNTADREREQQYVRVLREVTAGDSLGPLEETPEGPALRRFELSGIAFPAALVERMIAERMLAADGERGVVITAQGQRFFTRHR